MATLTPTQVTQAGATDALVVAAAGGDDFVVLGDLCWIEVAAGATPVTVTIDSKQLSNFGTDVNVAVTVPANSRRKIGPLPRQRFADPTTGKCSWTYDQVTGITVGAFRI